MSICETQGVKITARPSFLIEQSQPDRNKWVWSYEITVINVGEEAIQLVDRHWVITDAGGEIEEVRGEGVVGQQPVIEPGDSFSYQSFCPLATEHGFMRGAFGMVKADGSRFEAAVAPFVLLTLAQLN